MAIEGGEYTSFAIKANGTVSAWGRNDYGQTQVPEGLTNVIAIGAGVNSVAALLGPPERRVRPGMRIFNPRLTGSTFCVDTESVRAKTLVLEGSRDGEDWSMLRLVAGNDDVVQVCDPGATSSFNLYRLKSP